MDQNKFKKGKIQQAGSIVLLCVWHCLSVCLVLVLVQVLIDVELEAIIVHFLYKVVADGTDFLYVTQNVGVKINLINVRREALTTHRADLHGLSNGVLEAVLSLTIVAVGGSVLSLGGGSCGEGGIHLIISHLEVITAVVHTDLPYLDIWEKKAYCISIFHKNYSSNATIKQFFSHKFIQYNINLINLVFRPWISDGFTFVN